MPVLSVRVIKNPRKDRRCDNCGRYIDGETIRLYGMADYGDKPSDLYLHRGCVSSNTEKLILEQEARKDAK